MQNSHAKIVLNNYRYTVPINTRGPLNKATASAASVSLSWGFMLCRCLLLLVFSDHAAILQTLGRWATTAQRGTPTKTLMGQ